MRRALQSRPLTTISTATGVGITLYYLKSNWNQSLVLADVAPPNMTSFWLPPSRKDILQRLKGIEKGVKLSEEDAEFDLLIIGGGATGTGCALDGATRGLKVALVERDDFACGFIHSNIRDIFKIH